MSEDLVVGGGDADVITIWAVAEGWGERRKSKSRSKSKAAGGGARSTPSVRLTPKQLGEIAEAEFIARGVELRFVVAKPWGDSESYDYILNARRSFNFWRVQ